MRTVFTLSIPFAFRVQVVHSGEVTTRRDRLRAATIEEIKEAALGLIAQRGADALSMRGIARAIGMSPAGLYRYYDGLDALITELVTDAYNDLADAVAYAGGGEGTVLDRLRTAMVAYRQWCVDHPNRFLLIFGTPIPGYAAPEEGPTVEANRRIGEAFFAIAAEGWQRGELTVARRSSTATPGEVDFAASIASGFPAELVGTFISAWAHFHGLITLEILHQLDWLYADPAHFYMREVDAMLSALHSS